MKEFFGIGAVCVGFLGLGVATLSGTISVVILSGILTVAGVRLLKI